MFQCILPLACELDPTLSVQLFTHNPAAPVVPNHPHIRPTRLLPLERALSPIQVWKSTRFFARNLALSFATKGMTDAVWHSTYYTLPLGWRGQTVVTVYDLIVMRLPQYFRGWGYDLFRRIQRDIIKAADRIIAISETTRHDVHHYLDIPLDRIDCIVNGISTHFRQLADIDKTLLPTNHPFILYVGHRDGYKNFRILAEAYCRWPQRREYALVAVGPQWSGTERVFFQNAGVHSNTHVVADADDETLLHLYNAASAFVYPSLYEGFGLPLLEAIACGCPVIASEIPSSIEVAQEYPIYFTPTDVDSLIHALTAATQTEMSAAQRAQCESVHNRYSWEQTARNTLDTYYRAASVQAR